MEVEFGRAGGGVNGCVQTHFHVKANSVELCWGCVEDELSLWQINELYERDEIGKLHKLDELHEVDKLDELIIHKWCIFKMEDNALKVMKSLTSLEGSTYDLTLIVKDTHNATDEEKVRIVITNDNN